jgi:hypothetical protein
VGSGDGSCFERGVVGVVGNVGVVVVFRVGVGVGGFVLVVVWVGVVVGGLAVVVF